MNKKSNKIIAFAICLVLVISMISLYGCSSSKKDDKTTTAATTTEKSSTVKSTSPQSYTYINNTNQDLATYHATTSPKNTTVITNSKGKTVLQGTLYNKADHTTVIDGGLTLTSISLQASGINLSTKNNNLIDTLQFKISFDFSRPGKNAGNIVLYVANGNKIIKTYKFKKSDVSVDNINQTDGEDIQKSTWVSVKATEDIVYNPKYKYIMNIPKDTVRYKNSNTANQALSFAIYSPEIQG